jgi:hypothetical protein
LGPGGAPRGPPAEALAAARDAEMPEPSPIYWAHLSARVRDAVARETIAPGWRAAAWWQPFSGHRLMPIASGAALAGAVIVTGLMMRDARVAMPVDPSGGGPPPSADAAGGAPDESEAWQVLTAAAADTPIEDAHAAGMAVPAGAIDRAVQRMSADELNALGDLLQRELRRSGD